MDIQIRRISEDEFEPFLRVTTAAFGGTFRSDEVEPNRVEAEPEWSLAAFDGDRMVGTTAAASFDLTVPGGMAPAAGITSVAVLPTHRRRGILTALMRRQLDDVRDAGKPLAILHASEAVIYPRFGYGLATMAGSFDIDTRDSASLRPLVSEGELREVDEEEALRLFPRVYERVRHVRPGFVSRSPEWWRHRFWIPQDYRGQFGGHFFTVCEGSEGPEAYAAYRRRLAWPDDAPAGEIEITELVAATDPGYAATWRYLFDTDLVTRVVAYARPVDEPLLHLLAEPRRLRFRLVDGMWVRLVDARAALEARRYRSPGRLVLDVADDFCPWNAGRYELVATEDGAHCEITDAEPDLVLGAAELGALFLGGASAWSLTRAQRIAEASPKALERADAMFGWIPAPWCPEHF